MKFIANNEAYFEGIPSSYVADGHNINLYKDELYPGLPVTTLVFKLYSQDVELGTITFDKVSMTDSEFWNIIDSALSGTVVAKAVQFADDTMVTKLAQGIITLPKNLSNNKLKVFAIDAALYDSTRGRHTPLFDISLTNIGDTRALFVLCENSVRAAIPTILSLDHIHIDETGDNIYFNSAAQPLVLPKTVKINIGCNADV